MVDPSLLEKIKIQAVRDKRTVSSITEDGWREYLKGQGSEIKKRKPGAGSDGGKPIASRPNRTERP